MVFLSIELISELAQQDAAAFSWAKIVFPGVTQLHNVNKPIPQLISSGMSMLKISTDTTEVVPHFIYAGEFDIIFTWELLFRQM